MWTAKPQPLEIILDAINQDFATKEPLRIGGAGGFGPPFTGRSTMFACIRGHCRREEVDDARDDSQRLHEIAAVPATQRTAGEQRSMRQAFLELGADAAIRERVESAGEGSRMSGTQFVDSIQTVMVMEESRRRRTRFCSCAARTTGPARRCRAECPSVLPPLPPDAPNNRLGLAQWLVDPANPLTARVAVNRFWQMYFGTGLVKTVEDFGSQGEWPSHPELLDWLATEFVQTGWDVKELQKTIVMSATYRQSSAVRPSLLQQRSREPAAGARPAAAACRRRWSAIRRWPSRGCWSRRSAVRR